MSINKEKWEIIGYFFPAYPRAQIVFPVICHADNPEKWFFPCDPSVDVHARIDDFVKIKKEKFTAGGYNFKKLEKPIKYEYGNLLVRLENGELMQVKGWESVGVFYENAFPSNEGKLGKGLKVKDISAFTFEE